MGATAIGRADRAEAPDIHKVALASQCTDCRLDGLKLLHGFRLNAA